MTETGVKAKHVSSIAVGAPSSSSTKRQSIPSASAFGDDERHFDVSIVDETSPKSLDNGARESVNDEINPKFGKATLSKSAPVAEKIKEQLNERQSVSVETNGKTNGGEKDSNSETSSTVSDEKSSQGSQDIPDVKGQPTTWALFAQSLFQVRGSHSYCCAVLPNPLLPKKEKADHLASLASWVTVLRIMGDLPDSEYGDNIELAGSTPPVIASVKQNFHRKYGKKDVDDAQKKYTELFKDPAHAEVKDIPFLPSNSATMLDKVQYVCGLGIFRPEIRDELYCQVCKQLTNNPSRNSTVRGWVLLLMFAGSFAPTERFSPCFLQFLRDSPPVFASRVEKILRRTFIVGTRGYPPSWLEFQAAKNGKPILIPVALMNNHRMLVNSDSATTVQEICRQIGHRTNLKDPTGFSIYITLQQKISCLGHGTHRIMDAVAECEQHTKQMGMRESSSQWRLYFRKEFFTPWNDPKSDTMATDLIYQQVMRGITVGEYKCEKEEVLDLLAAQRFYCEYPNNTDTTKIKSFLNHWLPEEHKRAKPVDTWVQEVSQKLQNDIIKEKPEIESLKRDIVIFSKNKWFNIFSRFYDASKVHTPTATYHDSILGLNSKGLYIMDEQEDIKSQILFIEIVSVSRSRHSVTVQTVSGEECNVHSTHSEDLYTLLSTFLEGLRLKSKYALVIQDSTQIEGAIGVSVNKGDLVILDQPYEVYVQEDVISGTCKRTEKLHTMPRDLLYILPVIEEPPPEIMGMLSVQLRKDTSHFPTVPLYQEEHSLQNYAKVNFRSTSDNTINKLLSKASFKRSAKDKSIAAWQFQKEAIKKPLLRRTVIKEELRGTSCRSFLAIQQYMGDAPIKDSMSEMDIANELIIEPAMRSRHMRDEVYCQVVKQITNNPDRSSEEKGWQLLYLLSSCAVPSSDLYDECETFMKMSRHGMAQRCLEQFRRRKRDGARTYPPHTKEHENFSSKSKTIKISIAFPFQKQQHDFDIDPSSRVMDLKKQLVDKYDLESTEEYGLCFGLKDRGLPFSTRPPNHKGKSKTILISANDEEYFLDALSGVERFWMRPLPVSNGTDPKPGPSQPLVSVVHVFFLKKLWVNVEPGKNENADMMFHFPQEVPNYLRGYHSCSDKDAGKLGALIYRSNFGDDLSAMEFFGDNINALIPTPLIEKKTTTEWKKMVEENLVSTKSIKSNDAKLAFLRILSQWPTFGSVFFQVKQRSLKSFPKHILFAVNSEGVMFLDFSTKTVLAKYPYNKIPNWAFDEQSFTLVIGEGSSANKLYLETNLGHNIDDIIMSYVALMMNLHIKKKPNYSGVTVGESIC